MCSRIWHFGRQPQNFHVEVTVSHKIALGNVRESHNQKCEFLTIADLFSKVETPCNFVRKRVSHVHHSPFKDVFMNGPERGDDCGLDIGQSLGKYLNNQYSKINFLC